MDNPEIDWFRSYETHKNEIRHENDNMNQRVIWHMISQSFMVGAYTTLTIAGEKARNSTWGYMGDVLFWTIPISALAMCVFGLTSVIASLIFLRDLFRTFRPILARFPKGLPPEPGRPLNRVMLLAPLFLSGTLLIAWIVILSSQIAEVRR